MPTTDQQCSTFLGRSILSIRRNQVISMESTQVQELEHLEHFQKHISDRFIHLSTTENLLSIEWLQKLLDVFLCCEAEFKAVLVLCRDPSNFTKPPLDRLIPELLDRVLKALDICNAITQGIESIREWQKLAGIAVSALGQKPLGEGQIRRAKKALNSLVTWMTTLEGKDGSSSGSSSSSCSSNNKATERAWSFGRRHGGTPVIKERNATNFRSLSMSVSRTWSAAKQIQAMSNNLVMPRGGTESSGLALPVYVMSTVLVFVMWVLVTAIPCQDRTGLATHVPIPRQLAWAGPMFGLQERIAEEWKKKDKKGSVGLLEEMQRMEKCSQALIELVGSIQYPVEAEQMEQIGAQAAELADTCQRMEEGLVPLQRQVREVFHRMVKSRAEVLNLLDQSSKLSSPVL